MIKRFAFVVSFAVLTSCAPSAPSPQPGVERVEVSVDLTVDRQRVGATWILPAVQEQISSRRGDVLAAYNPLLAPFVTLEAPTISTQLRPAPGAARLFLMKLATGEGIGIEPFSITVNNAQSKNAAAYTTHNKFYLFDSASDPRRVVDYSYIEDVRRPCPANFRIADCDRILLSAQRTGGEALPATSAIARMVFLNQQVSEYRIPNLRGQSALAPLLPVGDAEVVHLDPSTLQQIRSSSTGGPLSYDLEYRGSTTWAFPENPPSQMNDPVARPRLLYRTDLPEKREAGWEHQVAGQLEYRGRVLTYDPVLRPRTYLAIVDPRRDLVILVGPPQSKTLLMAMP